MLALGNAEQKPANASTTSSKAKEVLKVEKDQSIVVLNQLELEYLKKIATKTMNHF